VKKLLTWGLAALATALGGCQAPPVEVPLGDVIVRLEPSPSRLSIRRSDGTMILDGLPGAPLDKGQPPNVDAAFRTAEASYNELFGAFQIDETAPAWQLARELSSIAPTADGVRFSLAGSDGGAHGEIRRIADGTLQITLASDRANRATAAFRCAADEHFLGFGAQTADVDHRGQTVPIWVSEQGIGKVATDDQPGDWFYRGTRHSSYFPVPFFVSSRNYGVLADTPRRSLFALCSESADAWRVEAWEGALSFHLFYGDSPLQVLERHTDFVGRAPVPPAWAFAPWNDAIHGADNVRRVAHVLRDNHVPSSAIWTEDWAGGVQNGDNYQLTYEWTVDRTLYPDVEAMTGELHGAGFKFLGYFNTFVNQSSPLFTEGNAAGFLIHKADGSPYLFDGVQFRPTSLVDLTNPRANDWMATYLSAALDLGFDGWMADYGEWLPVDAKLASGEDAEAVHSRYPVLWQKLNERVLSAKPDALAFVRSGATGSQPITHQVVWGGDQATEFDEGDGLPTVIPIGLGLGVVGMPMFGSDIAGYMTAPDHVNTTMELFFRWASLGALFPIMRTHHGVASGKNWSFESDAATLAHYKRWAEVHIRLYPYLAAAAQQASAHGTPIMRALGLAFPDDGAAWAVKDQFLLGPSLLVAPVQTAGATSRLVYFPKGRWRQLFAMTNNSPGDAAIEGPTTVEVAAPVSELPVFAPAGAIVVLLPSGIETLADGGPSVPGLASAGDSREVFVFAGGASDFAEPGGLTYHFESTAGPAATSLVWNDTPLTACASPAVAPCSYAPDGSGPSALVSGNGTLQTSDGGARLVVAAGAADRTLIVHFRF